MLNSSDLIDAIFAKLDVLGSTYMLNKVSFSMLTTINF